MATKCMSVCHHDLPIIVIINKLFTWHYSPEDPADYLTTGRLHGNFHEEGVALLLQRHTHGLGIIIHLLPLGLSVLLFMSLQNNSSITTITHICHLQRVTIYSKKRGNGLKWDSLISSCPSLAVQTWLERRVKQPALSQFWHYLFDNILEVGTLSYRY